MEKAVQSAADAAVRAGLAVRTGLTGMKQSKKEAAQAAQMIQSAKAKAEQAAQRAQMMETPQSTQRMQSAQTDQAAPTVQTEQAAQNSSAAVDTTAALDTTAVPAMSRPCGVKCGELPGTCAPMVFPYVPMQDENPVRYSRQEALQTGTLFPGLNLPFKEAIQAQTQLANTALVELMALDFAIDELGLYLTTHAEDQEALQLYWSYIQLSNEGRERYREQYGPLFQTDLTPEDGFAWLKGPWPWEIGGND